MSSDVDEKPPRTTTVVVVSFLLVAAVACIGYFLLDQSSPVQKIADPKAKESPKSYTNPRMKEIEQEIEKTEKIEEESRQLSRQFNAETEKRHQKEVDRLNAEVELVN